MNHVMSFTMKEQFLTEKTIFKIKTGGSPKSKCIVPT